MNRLLQVGFELAGYWHLADSLLRITIQQHGSQRNVLYAFACDGSIMYVGKSSRSLRERMSGYASQSSTGVTNIRVRRLLVGELMADKMVDVYALPDNGLMHYGPFHLNLAAGLEDSIIKTLAPPWNVSGVAAAAPEVIGRAASTCDDIEDTTAAVNPASACFEFTLQKTYRNTGFFNVGVAAASAFGSDGETIEIFFGDEGSPILGTINRRANQNQTPRVFGGPELRRRFETLPELARLWVQVLSPMSIRIRSHASTG